jgi:hypothetical protein
VVALRCSDDVMNVPQPFRVAVSRNGVALHCGVSKCRDNISSGWS